MTAARDTLQSWGGDAGPAARRHLGTVADRIEQLADNLADGDAPTALSGLILKAVGTLQHAVLQKAQTVAGLKSSTVFRAPALTASELDCLIDALEPDAADDVLLDAARVMRAEHLPLGSLLNPAGPARHPRRGRDLDRRVPAVVRRGRPDVPDGVQCHGDGRSTRPCARWPRATGYSSRTTSSPASRWSRGYGVRTDRPAVDGHPGDARRSLACRAGWIRSSCSPAGRPASGWVDSDDPLPPGWYPIR